MGIGAVRTAACALLCLSALAGCAPAPAERGPVATEAEAQRIAHQVLAGAPEADEPYEVQLDSIGWLVMTSPHPTARGQVRYLVRIDRTTGEADIGVYSVARTGGAS